MKKAENTIVVQTERKWGCLAFFLVFVAGVASGLFGAKHFRDATKMIVERDTTYIHDTTRILLPQETRYVKTTDTLLVQVTDTLVLRDTAYVVLQKEVKEYQGEEYFARVSGYRPSLDYIEVYPKTTVVTKTERIAPDKNGISIGLDVGNLWDFYIPIYIEYDRHLHKNVGARARLKYDISSKSVGAEAGMYLEFGW